MFKTKAVGYGFQSGLQQLHQVLQGATKVNIDSAVRGGDTSENVVKETVGCTFLSGRTDEEVDHSLRSVTVGLEKEDLKMSRFFAFEHLQIPRLFLNVMTWDHSITVFEKRVL